MLVMEGGGDMLILLTGVGGALSALGRDIPAKRARRSAGSEGTFSLCATSDLTTMRRQMRVR